MKSPSILVVCSDPTLRNVYAHQLRILGADAVGAENAKRALALASNRLFDRVLCADRVDNTSGVDLLRQIGFVSADSEKILLGTGSPGAGVSRVVATPFNFDELKRFTQPVAAHKATEEIEYRQSA